MICLLVNGKETLGHQQPYKRGHIEIREFLYHFLVFLQCLHYSVLSEWQGHLGINQQPYKRGHLACRYF